MALDWLALGAVLATGLLAGVLSALFGIGGGFVMVPLLHYVGGMAWHEATALSLLAIAIQSPAGVWQHARRGAVHWRIAIPLCIGGAVGVGVGVWAEPHVAVPWLKVLFAGLMLFAAWRMVALRKPGGEPRPPLPVPALAGVGVLSGLVGKLLGVGGGLVAVPVLTLTGTPVHVAVGTSLVSVFTNSAMASAEALVHGLDWGMAFLLAGGALVGVPAGAWIAHALPEQGLRRVFAAGAVAAALYIGLTSGVV